MKPKTTLTLAAVAALAVAAAASTRQHQAKPTACIYEVLAFADSAVIGWTQGCIPNLDVRSPEGHARLRHHAMPLPCGMGAIWAWPGFENPVVDTLPPPCRPIERKTDSAAFELP